ncbi:hypothetical protein F5Y16DRAFT_396921 [Xylariaceae sp. FL0255]|nr:hypothetical protein F5Y16DRAFT_396921 [Xylariaceae sp. FL0255]
MAVRAWFIQMNSSWDELLRQVKTEEQDHRPLRTIDESLVSDQFVPKYRGCERGIILCPYLDCMLPQFSENPFEEIGPKSISCNTAYGCEVLARSFSSSDILLLVDVAEQPRRVVTGQGENAHPKRARPDQTGVGRDWTSRLQLAKKLATYEKSEKHKNGKGKKNDRAMSPSSDPFEFSELKERNEEAAVECIADAITQDGQDTRLRTTSGCVPASFRCEAGSRGI